MKHLLCSLGLLIAWSSVAAPRVVSLSPAVTETIYQLGAQTALVGRSSACDQPKEAASLPVAGNFGIADVEKVLMLHPDYVIAHKLVNAPAERVFRRRRIKVLRLPCDNVADYCAMVRRLGELLDCPSAAAREIDRVETARARWQNLPRLRQKTLVVVWPRPLIVAGEGTFCNELVELAGACGVDFCGRRDYFTPDAEFILQSDPDVLLCLFPETQLADHPVLGKLRAVKENKVVFPRDRDVFQRPSPRWCEAVDELRKLLEAQK